MVQKASQYHYIYKCLADFASAQESEYVDYVSLFIGKRLKLFRKIIIESFGYL